MDPSDPKATNNSTYWWITSLAISIACCSVLFVWFSNYLYQIREEMAVARVHSEVMESRINEMSVDLQMLNHRSTVQQIQIIPNGNAQPPATETVAPAVIAAPPATAAPAPSSPPPIPAVPEMPVPAPAKH